MLCTATGSFPLPTGGDRDLPAGTALAWRASGTIVGYGQILGAHFYAVNGRFISRLHRYMCECETRPGGHPDGGSMGADGTLNHMRLLNKDIHLFLSVPNRAHQRSSRTDVHPHLIFDQIFSLTPLLSGGRRIKHEIRMSLDKVKLRRRRGL